jgi:hypothetical protein
LGGKAKGASGRRTLERRHDKVVLYHILKVKMPFGLQRRLAIEADKIVNSPARNRAFLHIDCCVCDTRREVYNKKLRRLDQLSFCMKPAESIYFL